MLSIKDLTKLEKKSFRDELGVFLIEGKKVFAEARIAGLVMEQILVSEKFLSENRDYFTQFHLSFKDLVIISQHNAERLSDTTSPAGLFAVIKKPTVNLSDLLSCSQIVALEDIRDPGNLGTMIRTADWFGVTGMIVTSAGVDMYNGKVLRASMGSVFHLKIFTSDHLAGDLAELQKKGFELIVTRPETSSTVQSMTAEKSCLIFGNESEGTSEQVDRLADQVFAIPKFGQAESLNVGVAFGITLHQLHQPKK